MTHTEMEARYQAAFTVDESVGTRHARAAKACLMNAEDSLEVMGMDREYGRRPTADTWHERAERHLRIAHLLFKKTALPKADG